MYLQSLSSPQSCSLKIVSLGQLPTTQDLHNPKGKNIAPDRMNSAVGCPYVSHKVMLNSAHGRESRDSVSIQPPNCLGEGTNPVQKMAFDNSSHYETFTVEDLLKDNQIAVFIMCSSCVVLGLPLAWNVLWHLKERLTHCEVENQRY